MVRSHILVCGGTGCTSSGSLKLIDALNTEIKAAGLEDEVKVVQTGCFGLCALGPIMIVYPDGTFYSRVEAADIPEIVSEHIVKGRVVERLVYNKTTEEEAAEGRTSSLNDTAFYKKQMRIALRNCGVINPEKIDEYIARDGYFALGKVLTEMSREEVVQ
ncbi:MAG: NAD(P)H-dependent oxidoreductase subunit E, partial [Clostridia bacterium]|nr:NAD(P)H-dependent oxidoreductase subunit E [Clostridia bacterium]